VTMTGSALLDRIGRDLLDAARREQQQQPSRRRAEVAARLGFVLAALAASVGTATAAGVGPFDRLFANQHISRPAADPGTIRVTAPASESGSWTVIAYRKDDGTVGLSAALDREGTTLPPVNWMGTAGIALGFRNVGPLSLRARASRDEADGAWLVYGFVQRGTGDISATVEGRAVPVYRSEAELSMPLERLDGSSTGETLSVAILAVPIDGLKPDDTAVARVTAISAGGKTYEQAITLE
jgi:hypothetical protein